MTKAEDAVTLFQQGFNCTQSTLSVFAADFGLDPNIAARISQGFGAGIGRTDEICGSLSGAHNPQRSLTSIASSLFTK